MGPPEHLALPRISLQGAKIFLDEYRGSLTFWTSNLLGGAFWILSSITGFIPFSLVALSLHFLPTIPFYAIYGPFGITLNYTPMTTVDGQREPDLRAMEAGEATLTNGIVSLYFRVNLSKRLNEFSLKFSAPDDLDVQLRDIPRAEHVYNRDERILSSSDISNREFDVVLDVYGDSAKVNENYPLEVVDELSQRTIERIDIIAK